MLPVHCCLQTSFKRIGTSTRLRYCLALRSALLASSSSSVVHAAATASHSSFSTSPVSMMSNKLNPEDFLSNVSKSRKPSPIRSLMPLLQIPGMISLGGGMPNPNLFPINGLKFTLRNGTHLDLLPEEVAESLQYSNTPGLAGLLKALKELQVREHQPRYSDWSVSVTTGSQDALWKCFEMLINPGDNVLCESPSYTGALAYLQPLGSNLVPVQTDKDGLVPESLEQVLSTLPSSGKGKPRVLYTIPTGQNPSGATQPAERRKRIYNIACKHNLLILEDDPYYFLYYGAAAAPKDISTYMRPRIHSYFSMDTQNRVLRFDSMSKVLSSGLRIGFVTGPTALIDQVNLTTQATNLHTSGVSQKIVEKLLMHWGAEGWDKQVRDVCLFYLQRRDVFAKFADKHLRGFAEWSLPDSSMFVWIKLLGHKDTKDLILKKAVDAKVLLLPGEVFDPMGNPSGYVRASFSTATDEQMDVALSRLADLLKDKSKL